MPLKITENLSKTVRSLDKCPNNVKFFFKFSEISRIIFKMPEASNPTENMHPTKNQRNIQMF